MEEATEEMTESSTKGWLGGLDSLLADVAAGRGLARHLGRLAPRMVVCAGLYGAVFGGWHGPRLAAYVALKFPLVLLLTSALTMLFSWMVARLLGLPLRFGQVGVLTFLGLTVASLLLASLTPVAWLFIHCAPPPSAEARTAHNGRGERRRRRGRTRDKGGEPPPADAGDRVCQRLPRSVRIAVHATRPDRPRQPQSDRLQLPVVQSNEWGRHGMG
jgi:hypothetical protein